MNSHLLAAAFSGIILGASSLAHAEPTYRSQLASSSDVTQLDASEGAKHACKGQNACKGQGGCKTDKNGCKGQNACKGQGGCRTDGGKTTDATAKDKNACSGKGGCGSK